MKEFGATYLCDRLSHRWLGTEGKGSCGWLPGAVIKEPHFVPPILELCSDERGEGMICAGTDLQWFPAVCTDEMTRGVVVVSCL